MNVNYEAGDSVIDIGDGIPRILRFGESSPGTIHWARKTIVERLEAAWALGEVADAIDNAGGSFEYVYPDASKAPRWRAR